MGNSDHKLYNLHFENRDQYLYVFVEGESVTKESSISFYREIFSKCEELDFVKVLIEENFKNQILISELFEVANFMAIASRGKIKIAHVDRQEKDHELNKFAETVAVNRGIYGKTFGNAEVAEKWLLDIE